MDAIGGTCSTHRSYDKCVCFSREFL